MQKFLTVVFVAVSLGPLARAQTSADLAEKYKRVTAYEVRHGILMTASFGAKGQVCEMALQKNRYPSENRVDLVTPLSKFETLLDELAPPVERGAEIKARFSGFIAGNVVQTQRNYENVSIEEVGGFSNACNPGTAVIIIRWKNRGCSSKTTEKQNNAVPASSATSVTSQITNRCGIGSAQ